MARTPANLDLSAAVPYHDDGFPPRLDDFRSLIKPLTQATAALARYDQVLKGMHNSEILLAPLLSQEAVISSRMEGTISTLDEVLRYEAEQDGEDGSSAAGARSETIEVFLYGRALKVGQKAITGGAPISNWLIRILHRELLGFGRGALMSPGEFKTEQNYLADRNRRKVMFIPISPERLPDGLDRMFSLMNDDAWDVLIRTALVHLEFEALHPFKDGNGRIGRMLITLMLWKLGVISEPHFYISFYFEEHRDEYLDRLRAVSATGNWTGWIGFFLTAIASQAQQNLAKAEEIGALYEVMKARFRELLSTQWSTAALDFIFTRPVFANSRFASEAGMPAYTANRITRILAEQGLLSLIAPAAGRRSALYSFEPLLRLVRGSPPP